MDFQSLTAKCFLMQPKKPPAKGTIIYTKVAQENQQGPEHWEKIKLTSGILKRYQYQGDFLITKD